MAHARGYNPQFYRVHAVDTRGWLRNPDSAALNLLKDIENTALDVKADADGTDVSSKSQSPTVHELDLRRLCPEEIGEIMSSTGADSEGPNRKPKFTQSHPMPTTLASALQLTVWRATFCFSFSFSIFLLKFFWSFFGFYIARWGSAAVTDGTTFSGWPFSWDLALTPDGFHHLVGDQRASWTGTKKMSGN